ncbi:hypothetical protein, partial [Rhizobium leguminosarum]|uniref:hypothetical protein n=1 Tax=Rhizobium leguminosarum TaxID=384 RepID=UPI001953F26E
MSKSPFTDRRAFRPAPSDRRVCPRFGRIHETTLHISIFRAFKQIGQILRNLIFRSHRFGIHGKNAEMPMASTLHS